MPGAAAQAMEARPNKAMPHWNARRAPKRSPSAPADSMNAAKATAYASTTHCRPATPAPRSRPIAGRATLTIVTSSWPTTKAIEVASTTSANDGAGRAVAAETAWASEVMQPS
jgi:hypothetical protein